MLVIASLGAGPWGAGSTLQHWTGELFRGICHQNPLRSYHINGMQMAVNTRCFGIFAGLLLTWVAIPAIIRLEMKKTIPLWLLLFAVMLQIIDFGGNYFGLWMNTNNSRFFAGLLLGTSVVLFISTLFKQQNNK